MPKKNNNNLLLIGGVVAAAFLFSRGGGTGATGATGQRGGTASILGGLFGGVAAEPITVENILAGGPGDDADFAFIADEDIGILQKQAPLTASQNVLTVEPLTGQDAVQAAQAALAPRDTRFTRTIRSRPFTTLGQVPVLSQKQAATLSPVQAANIGILRAVTGTFNLRGDDPNTVRRIGQSFESAVRAAQTGGNTSVARARKQDLLSASAFSTNARSAVFED